MNIKTGYLVGILILSGCAKNTQMINTISSGNMKYNNRLKSPMHSAVNSIENSRTYNDNIFQAANHYHVDAMLIKAIIQVESGFNPSLVSASNAVGLMQLKPATAGRDAYRFKGVSGQPSTYELQNPAVNIDLGAAYINIIQNQQLAGIKNLQTLHYATIVAYVNGAGAMLRTFAYDKNIALRRINQMSPGEFYQYIQKHHPDPQAPRYLLKVTSAYKAMLQ